MMSCDLRMSPEALSSLTERCGSNALCVRVWLLISTGSTPETAQQGQP